MQAAAAARKKLTDEVKAFQKQSEWDEVSVEAIINKAVAHADLQCKRCQDSEEAFMFTFKSVLPMGRTSQSFCSVGRRTSWPQSHPPRRERWRARAAHRTRLTARCSSRSARGESIPSGVSASVGLTMASSRPSRMPAGHADPVWRPTASFHPILHGCAQRCSLADCAKPCRFLHKCNPTPHVRRHKGASRCCERRAHGT